MSSGTTRLTQFSPGKSVEGRELMVSVNFDPHGRPPANTTLILGGVHGDEPATCELLAGFERDHLAHCPSPTMVWTVVNPDGLARGTRYNANGVDLNRNCEFRWSAESVEPPGPAPWSEPENRALRDLILHYRPAKIVTLHWALGELDADGPQSVGLLDSMWDALMEVERRPYRKHLQLAPPVVEGLPGSLGQWCGFAVKFPDWSSPAIVTLELPHDPDGIRAEDLPEEHLDEMRARWRMDANGYLAALCEPVVRMLLAASNFVR